MYDDESPRPDDQMGADEQVSQIDEDLERTAEPNDGVEDFPVTPGPMP